MIVSRHLSCWTLLCFLSGALLLAGCGSSSGSQTDNLPQCDPDNAEEITDTISDTRELDGCYLIDRRISIQDGGAVTVAPGTTILFTSDGRLRVMSGGSLSAAGTEELPILFTGVEKAPGYWYGLSFEGTQSPSNLLEHVIIEYGGTGDANLIIREEDTRVEVRNSTLRHSSEYGLMVAHQVSSTTNFGPFEDNRVESNAVAASVALSNISAIKGSNEWTDNDDNVVYVTNASFFDDVTFQDSGIPFVIANSIRFGEDSGRHIEVEAGVELLMAQGMYIIVHRGGSFAARGTADDPVVIRGVESLPGYWEALIYAQTVSSDNVLQNVVISDGGAAGDDDNSALELRAGRNDPMQLFVEDDLLIKDSNGHGIYTTTGNDGVATLNGCGNIRFENIAGDDFGGDNVCP